MNYRYIDMEAYKRKEHFEYFKSLAYPYVGVTVNVDITEFLEMVRAKVFSGGLLLCRQGGEPRAGIQAEDQRQ